MSTNDRGAVWSRIAVAEDNRIKDEQRWEKRFQQAKNPEETAAVIRCQALTQEARGADRLKELFSVAENPPLSITARVKIEKAIDASKPQQQLVLA